jgi:hypothetical protein
MSPLPPRRPAAGEQAGDEQLLAAKPPVAVLEVHHLLELCRMHRGQPISPLAPHANRGGRADGHGSP